MEVELTFDVMTRVPEATNADGYGGLLGTTKATATIDLDDWDEEPVIQEIRRVLWGIKQGLDFTLRYEAAKAAGCDMTKWFSGRDTAALLSQAQTMHR